jgi:RNA polymerase sigma factor for flagellar operon FliA
LPGTQEDPERHAARRQLNTQLRDALQALPSRDRYVIRLYDFEEWTMKRIGERLGVNESRVSQIRAAALKRLKTELGRCGVEYRIA